MSLAVKRIDSLSIKGWHLPEGHFQLGISNQEAHRQDICIKYYLDNNNSLVQRFATVNKLRFDRLNSELLYILVVH